MLFAPRATKPFDATITAPMDAGNQTSDIPHKATAPVSRRLQRGRSPGEISSRISILEKSMPTHESVQIDRLISY
jgi:hypothetical protein